MAKANYIIFHPDNQRDTITVKAIALVENTLKTNWSGNIHVDKIGVGNEDPFVFNDPWLYSYCHASQLRRNIRSDSYLQIGSKIIFASGQDANKGILAVDTVFIVGRGQEWGRNPLKLPKDYFDHYENNSSSLWQKHFKSPFDKVNPSHKSVSHTYESEQWDSKKEVFSFLPLNINKDKASISFSTLNRDVSNKIKNKVKGKYPVLLTDKEIENVLKQLDGVTVTKVLKCIIPVKPANIIATSKKHKC